MKKWYIELLVNYKGELMNPCGTDYSILYDDLKTLRGVINRLKKLAPFITTQSKDARHGKDIVGLNIYTYTNLYDESTYNLECKTSLGDELFREILSCQVGYKNNK